MAKRPWGYVVIVRCVRWSEKKGFDGVDREELRAISDDTFWQITERITLSDTLPLTPDCALFKTKHEAKLAYTKWRPPWFFKAKSCEILPVKRIARLVTTGYESLKR